MPSGKETQHKRIKDFKIPYRTFDTPNSTDLMFQDGANVLVSIPGFACRRPGFSEVAVPGTFTGTIQRIFPWKKWLPTGAVYIVMVCSTDATNSYVYKFQFGTDAAAVLIHTDASSNSPFDFVVSTNTCYFGKDDVSGQMWKYDGTTVSKWGIDPPAAPVIGTTTTGATASDVIQAGKYIRCTYGNSSTGHQSSASDLSACVGANTTKLLTATLVASTDPQVDQIHVYSTTDGGSTNPLQMQEVPGSPFPNASATVSFSPQDLLLQDVFAPGFYRNDPPKPMRGFITSQNRIWGFSGNTLYYSGYEEIGSGVGEESWPGGLDGNYRPYATPVEGLAETTTGVAIFSGLTIYGVDGDSLDTFRFSKIMSNRGTQNLLCVTAFGGTVGWIDTSKQAWTSDTGEIGVDIRPNLEALEFDKTRVAVYIAGKYHWFVIHDGANDQLLVLDLDRMQWCVPWPITGITAMASGQTANDRVDLLIARNGKILRLKPGTFSDDCVAYPVWATFNLFDIAPEENPDEWGYVDYVGVESDTKQPVKVEIQYDDDTHLGNYQDITANMQDPPLKAKPGSNVVKKEYRCELTTCRRISPRLTWAAEDADFKLEELDIAYRLKATT